MQKQKRHLEEKVAVLKADDTKLSRTARAVLALFDKKKEWTSAEVAAKLKLNIETTKKALKSLVDGGYLVKHGTTKGAWYEKIVE